MWFWKSNKKFIYQVIQNRSYTLFIWKYSSTEYDLNIVHQFYFRILLFLIFFRFLFLFQMPHLQTFSEYVTCPMLLSSCSYRLPSMEFTSFMAFNISIHSAFKTQFLRKMGLNAVACFYYLLQWKWKALFNKLTDTSMNHHKHGEVSYRRLDVNLIPLQALPLSLIHI